jgi:hypothetical protein
VRRSQIDAALAELYDRIPALPACDGRCWTSCGPIDMSWRERQRIRAAGVTISPWRQAVEANGPGAGGFWCEALTAARRCAVYEMRPLICRLWGATVGMACPYGCVPEGGWLSDEECLALIAESMEIGGHELAITPADVEFLASRDPGFAEQLLAIVEENRARRAT